MSVEVREHELLIFRAGGIGGWWAECGGCLGWEGRIEDNRPDALQHFWAHTRGESLPALSGVFSEPVRAPERRARRFWPLVGLLAIALGVLVVAGFEGGAFTW